MQVAKLDDEGMPEEPMSFLASAEEPLLVWDWRLEAGHASGFPLEGMSWPKNPCRDCRLRMS